MKLSDVLIFALALFAGVQLYKEKKTPEPAISYYDAQWEHDHELVVLVCTSKGGRIPPDKQRSWMFKMGGEVCMAVSKSDGIIELPEGTKYMTVYVPNR